jgi:uncharacterized membrane protein YeaQ/YmgE (transglycosylase-associated protein family)
LENGEPLHCIVHRNEGVPKQQPILSENPMSLIVWIALGLIAGIIASQIFGGSGMGEVVDVVHGVVGAVFGGWLFKAFGTEAMDGINLYGLLAASICSIVLLAVYRAVTPTTR